MDVNVIHDMAPIQPEQFPLQSISPDNTNYPSFPFSGSINNPVLSQSNAPESTGKPGGC